MRTPSDKIKTLPALRRIAARLRAGGRTIVLANGIFDLFHVGHVRYLSAAKALGDVLVVAMNDDASARALKGRGRPVIPLRERLEILSAVSVVDYCVPFSGRTVKTVIDALRPDIHAKGTDYTRGTVPERDDVLACGGRIAIVGDPKRHATSTLIRRIARHNGP